MINLNLSLQLQKETNFLFSSLKKGDSFIVKIMPLFFYKAVTRSIS